MKQVRYDIPTMLRDIPLKVFIVMGFLLVGLLPVIVEGLISFEVGRSELKKQAFRQLETVRAIKTSQIVRFFEQRLSDVNTLAVNPYLIEAYYELRQAAHEVEKETSQQLKGLDHGQFEAPQLYKAVHTKYMDFMTHYIRQQGYYDLLLLDENGVAIFTVEKEADFGVGHATESSALGDAWRAIMDGKKDILTDMKLYAPSKNAPAQFVAAPIITENYKGVLILQISLDSINEIMREHSGMGYTGESYLVGQDHRMRSNSVLAPNTHSIVESFNGSLDENGVNTEAVQLALNNKSGSKVITGYRGTKVLSVFAPLKTDLVNWAIIAEIEERETDHSIDRALSKNYLVILGISIAAGLLLSLMIYGLVSRQLDSMVNHLSQLSNEVLSGNLNARGDSYETGPDLKNLLSHVNNLIDAFASRMNDLPVPVLMIDTQYTIRFCNTKAGTMAGNKASDLCSRSCAYVFGCQNCNTTDKHNCPVSMALTSGKAVNGETILYTNNQSIPVAYTGSPVCHPGGDLLGIWMVFMDQTDAKKMSAENRRLENQLYRAQRLDALGTMTSGIAHDFNNILSYMMVDADLVSRNIPDDSQARVHLNKINSAINRAAGLIQQMLIFSRKMDGKNEVFDAVPVILDSLELLKTTLPDHIELHYQTNNGSLETEGDPTHLSQVVINLCTNARDAIDKKQGIITVKLSSCKGEDIPPSVSLSGNITDNKYLTLSVTDNGCGMDKATREHAFEPFFTTSPPGKGTGLGLSVVHGIVTTSGGFIKVTSQPERGTDITVWLPLAYAV